MTLNHIEQITDDVGLLASLQVERSERHMSKPTQQEQRALNWLASVLEVSIRRPNGSMKSFEQLKKDVIGRYEQALEEGTKRKAA